ncbi:MAG TPA: VanZ family protein [Desulfuromonadales bacterium]|nr:VanZ family protein [Desulfuromonadales bacterium]
MKQTVFCRKCLLARLAALLLWAGCLLWLSLTPTPPSPPSELLSWDKLQHAGAYALLTLLAGRFISQWRPLIRQPWLYALLVAVVFGGMVEILQGTLTGVRQAEWGDLIADAAGGMVVVVAALIREHWLLRKSS